MSKEAMQQALEKIATVNAMDYEYQAWAREALAEQALDKMAENARKLGLDYEPAQRTWVGLSEEEKQEWIDAMPYDIEPRHCMILLNVMEVQLKQRNT